MKMKIHQETESPWSTPTESEIGAAEKSASSKERDKAFSELGLKVKESLNPKLKQKRKIVKNNMKDVPPSPKKRLPKQNSQVQTLPNQIRSRELWQELVRIVLSCPQPTLGCVPVYPARADTIVCSGDKGGGVSKVY